MPKYIILQCYIFAIAHLGLRHHLTSDPRRAIVERRGRIGSDRINPGRRTHIAAGAIRSYNARRHGRALHTREREHVRPRCCSRVAEEELVMRDEGGMAAYSYRPIRRHCRSGEAVLREKGGRARARPEADEEQNRVCTWKQQTGSLLNTSALLSARALASQRKDERVRPPYCQDSPYYMRHRATHTCVRAQSHTSPLWPPHAARQRSTARRARLTTASSKQYLHVCHIKPPTTLLWNTVTHRAPPLLKT